MGFDPTTFWLLVRRTDALPLDHQALTYALKLFLSCVSIVLTSCLLYAILQGMLGAQGEHGDGVQFLS